MKKLFFGKRGVSVVEAVIAMAIITIVSATAIVVASTSMSISNKNQVLFMASSNCESIANCFCVSKNEDSFIETLKYIGINIITEEENTYTYQSQNATYKIEVSDGKKIDISVLLCTKMTKDGEKELSEIWSYTYTKAEGWCTEDEDVT